MLWLNEIWHGAQSARAHGVHCVGVTVWALLGSFNWCHLVTRDTGAYEPGVFTLDTSTQTPTTLPTRTPTPLATFVHQLATGTSTPSPTEGWWSHPDRLTFPPEPPTPEPEFQTMAR